MLFAEYYPALYRDAQESWKEHRLTDGPKRHEPNDQEMWDSELMEGVHEARIMIQAQTRDFRRARIASIE